MSSQRVGNVPTHGVDTDERFQLTLKNIVLAFPDGIQSLPANQRHRLTLWHSAVIYILTDTRRKAIWTARQQVRHTHLVWDSPTIYKRVMFEIRRVSWKIYLKAKEQKHPKTTDTSEDVSSLQQFDLNWCTDNTICVLRASKLMLCE
jgi:hypothetical protein